MAPKKAPLSASRSVRATAVGRSMLTADSQAEFTIWAYSYMLLQAQLSWI
jgi:hypothetical protein